MIKKEFNQQKERLMEEKYQSDTCINKWDKQTDIQWGMNEIQ